MHTKKVSAMISGSAVRRAVRRGSLLGSASSFHAPLPSPPLPRSDTALPAQSPLCNTTTHAPVTGQLQGGELCVPEQTSCSTVLVQGTSWGQQLPEQRTRVCSRSQAATWWESQWVWRPNLTWTETPGQRENSASSRHVCVLTMRTKSHQRREGVKICGDEISKFSQTHFVLKSSF